MLRRRRQDVGGGEAALPQAHALHTAADVHDAVRTGAALPWPRLGVADGPLDHLRALLAILVDNQAKLPVGLVPSGIATDLQLDADHTAFHQVDNRPPAHQRLAKTATAHVRPRQVAAHDEGPRQQARRGGQQRLPLGCPGKAERHRRRGAPSHLQHLQLKEVAPRAGRSRPYASTFGLRWRQLWQRVRRERHGALLCAQTARRNEARPIWLRTKLRIGTHGAE
mmetsp:Transcript_7490/g.19144  ORF Transcript_7490/g.19144 Transcript_7490/m.19144 type:complete len:224 (-) Transcript_7490:176-847(-)